MGEASHGAARLFLGTGSFLRKYLTIPLVKGERHVFQLYTQSYTNAALERSRLKTKKQNT